MLSKNISNYKINIDIKSNQIKEKIIEVETMLSLIILKRMISEKNKCKKLHAYNC